MSGFHNDSMGGGSSSTVWSAAGSALANSTLAAVLAGFMINGIILLLSYAKLRAEYVQAVALLFAAFIALGIDAFLFGLVTGENTGVFNGVTTCRRAWTEAMFGAGLLGIGAVAIVVGFTVLFSVYFCAAPHDGNDREWHASMQMLQKFCLLMRGTVAAAVIGLLYVTSRAYLITVFDGNVPIIGTLFLYGYVIAGGSAILVITGASLSKKPGNPVLRWLRAETRWKFLGAMRWAIGSMMVYTMLATLMAAAASAVSAHYWNPAYTGTRVIFGVTVAWVSVASLLPLMLLLFRTVPGLVTPLPEGEEPTAFTWRAIFRFWERNPAGPGGSAAGNGGRPHEYLRN